MYIPGIYIRYIYIYICVIIVFNYLIIIIIPTISLQIIKPKTNFF